MYFNGVPLFQLMNLNPQLRTMLDSNPQLREMMQNPDFLRQFSSPEMMQVSWAAFVVFMHVNFANGVSPKKHFSFLYQMMKFLQPNVIDCFFLSLANDDSTAVTVLSE